MAIKGQRMRPQVEWTLPGEKRERQILVFKVAMQELGIDISCVREVLRTREIYPLPKAPDFIEGMIYLRGHIIAIIDLQKRLHPNNIKVEDSHKKIIVCQINKMIIGVIVQSLKEIVSIPVEEIKPTPQVVSLQMETAVISGVAKIGEKIVPILNLEHLITKDMVQKITPGEG